MQKFEIEWSRYPTNFNTHQVAIVEAENETDARALFYDAVKKRYQIPLSEFGILKMDIYQPVTAKGKVLSLG